MLAVLLQRSGADNLHLAARQRRLQNVGSIHRALGRAGADDGVQLIDEQNHIARLFDLVNGVLDPLLEIAAVLRTGHHTGQIQRHDTLAAQQLRHLVVHDLLRQPLRDGGLADARLTDQARIVFGTAGQNLNHPLDLLGTSDHRVELALGGQLGQIAAELVERRRFAAALCRMGSIPALGRRLRHGRLNGPRHILQQLVGRDTEGVEDPHRHAALVLRHRHQNVLGSHVAVLQHGGIGHRHLHGFLGTGREVIRRQPRPLSAGLKLYNPVLPILRRNAAGAEHRRRYAGSLLQQPEHNVLGADVGMAELLGRLHGQIQCTIGLFRKSFETIHTITTFPVSAPHAFCHVLRAPNPRRRSPSRRPAAHR